MQGKLMRAHKILKQFLTISGNEGLFMREKKENYMSKKTKLLIALLSATALTAGAFGIAGCAEEAYSKKYYEMYQSYVAEAGDSALSYDDWLDGVLEEAKGQQGEKGEDGEDGADGATWISGEGAPEAADGKNGDFYLDTESFTVYNKSADTWTVVGSIKGQDGAAGATGDGIQSIAYENGKLIVTLTSGAIKEVELPAAITHEHTYGDTVTTLIDPTGTKEGLAYKSCNDCDHIELVVLPKLEYEITVNYNGAPVANVEVTVSGADIAEEGYVKATTDGNGLVTISPAEAGEYTITVAGYVVISGGKTSEGKIEYTVEVAKPLEDGADLVPGIYASDVDPFTATEFTLSATEEAVMYKISLEGNALMDRLVYNDGWMAYEQFAMTPDENGVYGVVIEADSSSRYDVAVDMDAMFAENPDYDYSAVPVVVTVTSEAAPEVGNALRPASIDLGSSGSATVSEDGWAYFSLNVSDDYYEITGAKLTFGEGIYVEFTQTNYGYDAKTPIIVTSGEGFDLATDGSSYGSRTYSFRAKVTDGSSQTIEVSTEVYVAPGTYDNPDTAVTGENTLDLGMGQLYYYKWDASASGDYVFEVQNGFVTIYSSSTYAYRDYVGDVEEGGVFGLTTTDATTYYIKAEGSGEGLSFTIRNYNEATDLGKVPTHPISVEDWTTSEGNSTYAYSNADIANRTKLYFTMTAPIAGRMVIVSTDDAVDADGNPVAYNCSNSGVIYEEGDEITVEVVSYNSVDGYYFNIEWHALSADTVYNITLKDTDGAVVEGAVLTATPDDGSDAIVAAATDTEGKTTITLDPSKSYTFTAQFVDGAMYDTYSWTMDTTSGNYDFGGDIEIGAAVKLYAHTVYLYDTDGTTPIVGATVSLKQGSNGMSVGEAVTDEDGKAVIYAAKITSGMAFSSYSVQVTYPEGYDGYTASGSIAMGSTEVSITSGKVNVVGDDHVLVEGTNKVTIANPYGVKTEFTFTATAAGTYNIALQNNSAAFWYLYIDGVSYGSSKGQTVEATEGQVITVGLMSISAVDIVITKA